MGKKISFFANYKHKENALTNYCGLLMKLLYEDSPIRFEMLLANLINNETSIIVRPTFTQQEKKGKGIPDLVITQRSFSIYFEIKTSDWFYDDQINRHLSALDLVSDNKILFLLSNFENDNLEDQFKILIEKAKTKNIILKPITFEYFVISLEQVFTSEYLKNLLEEFKSYLDENEYFPKWKYLLDVVSCSETMNEINEGVYMCPDTGGAYRHRRAKFFGPYAKREVSCIFEIKAVVVIEKNLGEGKIKWNNSNVSDEILIQDAKNKIQIWEWRINENKSTALQVFLLDKKEPTIFKKDTSRGMYTSKMYFRDIAIDCTTSKKLAAKLNNKNWSAYLKEEN